MFSRILYLVGAVAILTIAILANPVSAQQASDRSGSFVYNGVAYGEPDTPAPMYVPSTDRQYGPKILGSESNCRATLTCGSISTSITGTTCTSCITCSCTIEKRSFDGTSWTPITGSPFSNMVCSSSTMPSSPTPAQRRACRNSAISGVDGMIPAEWTACQARC
ncbi:MAG: hypothetical protein EYC62_09770 [Alphaproteobacteria bacterium]|nr:MAG: hypothetical protein EYC62_09770 [Alphaproteobacteria bacterium]